jgi:hypothetical protein
VRTWPGALRQPPVEALFGDGSLSESERQLSGRDSGRLGSSRATCDRSRTEGR